MSSKVRVYELAKELGTNSKKIIQVLEDMDIKVKNHMSTINEDTAQQLISRLTGKEGVSEEAMPGKQQAQTAETAEKDKAEKDKKEEQEREEKRKTAEKAGTSTVQEEKKKDKDKDKVKPSSSSQPSSSQSRPGRKARKARSARQAAGEEKIGLKKIVLEGSVIVSELASKLEVPSTEIISKLMEMGIICNINQEVEPEVIELLAEEYQVDVEFHKDPVEEKLRERDVPYDKDNVVLRPPVVTVLGHVDHGKTTLLDYIRETSVTSREFGGITQHIGAYQVNVNEKRVVFLDTPGHEAFTSMRARGAQATDIVILIVAADDGVMPQTVEAINHVKAANVPLIVAINKIDKANANEDRLKQQLLEQELVPEEWGGDTICIPISAAKGEGVEELLEMILLVAEMNEFTANEEAAAYGVVIEAKLDKGKGPVATVLVKDGTLKTGDPVICGHIYGKVRAMINDKGDRVSEALPSTPVEIQGLTDVPQAGDQFQVVNDEKLARQLSERKSEKLKEAARRTQKVSFEDLFKQIQEGEVSELNIIIKGDVQGSIEALESSLQKLSNEEVKIKIIHTGVGPVTETDVMLASASEGVIIGFNVRPNAKTRKLAEKENVDIRLYRVIYETIEDLKSAIKGMLKPEYREVVQGTVEVRQLFKISRIGTVAGSYVTEGKINRNSLIRVLRDGQVIHEGKLSSLKRFQEDVKEVVSGYECGILLDGFNDLKEGDILEAYTYEEVKP